MIVKLDHSPKVRGENKKYLSCHHPENPKSMLFSTLFLCYPNLWKPHSQNPEIFLIEVTVQGVRQEGLDLHKKLIREALPGNSLWPFWDGENVTLEMVI